MIVINNIKFENTTQLSQYINQEIRNKYNINSRLNQADETFIKELISYRYTNSFVNSIASIIIVPNKFYGKKQKVLLAFCKHYPSQLLNISDAVSEARIFFEKNIKRPQEVIDKRYCQKRKETALRYTIYDQIHEFKTNYKKHYTNHDFSDYEVDHVYPEFKEIIDNWLKSKGITWEDLEICNESPGVFKLTNEKLAQDFKRYHKKIANLEYIPKGQNFKKQQNQIKTFL